MATLPAIDAKKRNILLLCALQVLLIVLFVIFVRYDDGQYEAQVYPMFQDIHAMIFVGFGFLMTFLKRYGFSSVGFNFLLASLVVQWAILCEGFFKLKDNKVIEINISSIISADIASAAVLISMGAVLGRTSFMQLIIMGIIEIAVFAANATLGEELEVVDPGDSIYVHAFGAYFGLAVSFVLERKKKKPAENNGFEGSSYNSDIFAMIGTIFLWIFWPSFNAVGVTGDDQHRAVLNTYLSLSACCVTAYALSAAFTEDHKFDMVHIQNSTLAGGVAMGASCHLMVQPWGALMVGCAAAAVSVSGYSFLTPAIRRRLGIADTCGVHNLHGMPALLAALVSALMAGLASEDMYSKRLYQIYPAMAPSNASATTEYAFLEPGHDRTSAQQAGYQLLGALTTVIIAIVSGLITGYLLVMVPEIHIHVNEEHKDDPYWMISEQDIIPTISIGKLYAKTEYDRSKGDMISSVCIIISTPLTSRIPGKEEYTDDPYWLIHEHAEHKASDSSATVSVSVVDSRIGGAVC